MRRFIAHIGAHKTGTTAFQTWLQQHRSELFAAGYLVPRSGSGNHARLFKAMHDRSLPRKSVDQFLAEARGAPTKDLLVSAEYLNNAEPPALAAIGEQIDMLASRKVAVFVVRDPVAHFNSGYAQKRKAMKSTFSDFEEFVDAALGNGRADWKAKVELFECAGFDMRVHAYNTEFTKKGVSRSIIDSPEFGDLAGRFVWSDRLRANDSAGAIGLIIMDLILAAGGAASEEVRSRATLRERVIAVARERFADTPFNGFTPETRRRVIEHYREGNAWIAERFFGSSWDEVLPAQPEQPLSPQSIDDLPAARAAEVRRAAAEITAEAREAGWL